jgi:hypothetical protein
LLIDPEVPKYRTVVNVIAKVDALYAQGNRSAALEAIANVVRNVVTDEASLGRVLASPELTTACAALGRPIEQTALSERNEDLIVFVVSTFRPVGGHSRLLLDIVEADPCKNAVVLLSNFEGQTQPVADFELVLQRIGLEVGIGVEAAPAGSAEDRLRWLQSRLADLRPIRTYLLENPDDSVAVAACQPELVGQLYYVHHIDHSLNLGMHLHGATHVDLTSKTFQSCREIFGLDANVYWPLCPRVPDHRGEPFLRDGALRSATCGTANKFDTWYLNRSTPYVVGYPEIVPLILRNGVETHVHIGEMTALMLDEINERLKSAGIDDNRFLYLPYVPSLSKALLDLNIDVYIGSFPFGGGTTTVEAMGTGIPPIIHSNYRSLYFTSSTEVYDGAMVWRTPEELMQLLRGLNPSTLEQHASRSRQFYEQYHSPDVLRGRVMATLEGKAQPPPPIPPHYRSDPLQTFLDDRIGEEKRRADAVTAERTRLTAIQDAELARLTARHNTELERMHAQHEARLRQIHEEQVLHVSQLQQERADHTAQLNQLQQECAERAAQLNRVSNDYSAELASLRGDVAAAIRDRDNFTASLDAMRSSRSWKLSAPLRSVLDRISGTRG